MYFTPGDYDEGSKKEWKISWNLTENFLGSEAVEIWGKKLETIHEVMEMYGMELKIRGNINIQYHIQT